MKYKELPAFETNEFKIGDRVRVYGVCEVFNQPEIYEGIVYQLPILEDEWIGHVHIKLNNETYKRALFQQCYKIEEIKPREWYIDPIFKFYAPNGIGNPAYEEKEDSTFIKVREVLEEE